MTVKIRSITGDKKTNSTSFSLNSPATISLNDKLRALLLFNDNTVQSITPPAGFSLLGEVADGTLGTAGRRYMLYEKDAVQADVDNAGTLNHYTFSGASGDDLLYTIAAMHDDAGGSPDYVSGSLALLAQFNGGASTDAPSQTIGTDGSMLFAAWGAHNGTDWFKIDQGEAYTPTGGANAALHHAGFVAQSMSGDEWVVGSAEFDIVDSPTGLQELTHATLSADVDHSGVSMVFEPVSTPAGTVTVGQVGENVADVIFDNELRVKVNGTGFGALQGAGTVELHDADPTTATPTVTVAQTVRSWSDTQVVIDVDKGTLVGDSVWLSVTENGAGEGARQITVKDDPGAAAIGTRAAIADQNFIEGQAFQLETGPYFFASDVQDQLTVTVAGLPAGLSFNGTSISGNAALGTNLNSPYTVTVDCVDVDGNAAPQDSFSITVAAQPPPATFAGRRRHHIRTQRMLSALIQGVI